MNIAQAIQILEEDNDCPGSVDIEDVNEAEELAIEALTFIQHSRVTTPGSVPTLLLGETQ